MTENSIRDVTIGATVTVMVDGSLITGPFGGISGDDFGVTVRVGDWVVDGERVTAWAKGKASLDAGPEVKFTGTPTSTPVDFDLAKFRDALKKGLGIDMGSRKPGAK